jgi:Na+-translocating ferredoxin:NAD+ oxidoreductase subunit E
MPAPLPNPTQRFIQGILPENPVYRQLLAMCPTLAVTNTIAGAITMAGATAFVLICANIIASLLRNLLQPHLRILVFTVIIATFVTIADRSLAAFLPEMSQKLGPYIPLIIVNCMIICRCEVCGSKQGVAAAAADAVGQSLGFLLALLSVSVVREILGAGTILEGWAGVDNKGIRVLPESFPNFSLLVQPAGAFFTLGILLGVANWIQSVRAKKAAA